MVIWRDALLVKLKHNICKKMPRPKNESRYHKKVQLLFDAYGHIGGGKASGSNIIKILMSFVQKYPTSTACGKKLMSLS
jgi:hypothetical protein